MCLVRYWLPKWQLDDCRIFYKDIHFELAVVWENLPRSRKTIIFYWKKNILEQHCLFWEFLVQKHLWLHPTSPPFLLSPVLPSSLTHIIFCKVVFSSIINAKPFKLSTWHLYIQLSTKSPKFSTKSLNIYSIKSLCFKVWKYVIDQLNWRIGTVLGCIYHWGLHKKVSML